MVKKILKIEGLVFLISSLFFYYLLDGNWLLFLLLILTPDISMLGYLKNKRIGAFIYNLVHNYIFPLLLIWIGLGINNFLIFQIGLIIFAHVGGDRLFSFGLKYRSDFKDTHLQKV